MNFSTAIQNKTHLNDILQSMSKRLVVAFDLDHTLIDSSHRTRVNEQGQFDLAYWKEKSHWEYIKKDTILPLYALYEMYKKSGMTIIAVTAREMNSDDYRYLEEHGLVFDMILERGSALDLDHILKDQKLQKLFSEKDLIPYLFFDDKEDNLRIAEKYKFIGINSHLMNLKMVVKNQHAIRNLDMRGVPHFTPKKEDLTKTAMNIL